MSKVLDLVNNPKFMDELSESPDRSGILPSLFKVRGVPYSLKDHPQFKVFYEKVYVPEMILMSARQCGKTQNLGNSSVLDTIQIPHFRNLYVAPLKDQAQRFSSEILIPAINSCFAAKFLQGTDLPLSDSKIIQAVFHQSFANGSSMQLGYAKTSPDRLRGITCDRLDFDELQDQLIDNIHIIKESISTSSWAICRYTGTAKTLDNTIERTWQRSSRCEWVIKCEGCNHHNIPDSVANCMAMIRADGIRCIKCGKMLNSRLGEWVAAVPEKMPTFRGYHVPQIVLPYHTENPWRWNNIITKLHTLDETTIANEVLGISSSVGVRIITPEDIERNSVLPPMKDIVTNIKARNKPAYRYNWIVSGVDWGGQERVSFTVHTILGVSRNGEIHVLYGKRYAGFDPDTVFDDISKAHAHYRANFMCSDFGMGFMSNQILIKRYGIPVVQMHFSDSQMLMQYSPRQGYPCWSVGKSAALNTMFMAIKYNQFKFPREPEGGATPTNPGFKVLSQDLLSPYEEVIDKGFKETRRYTRDPALADDFAMALCYASLGAYTVMHNDITTLIPPNSFVPTNDEFSFGTQINPSDIRVGI